VHVSVQVSNFLICVKVSKEFFPDVAIGYEDSRVTLHVGDGVFLFLIQNYSMTSIL
jgi:hypothetical protein